MRPGRDTTRELNEFARSRDADKERNAVQNGRAARTVASHSLDARDCQDLLAMLGLTATGGAQQEQAAPW